MFERLYRTDLLDDGTGHGGLWPRSGRARRRAQERAVSRLVSEVRWVWRSACQGTPLAQVVYTPSGPTRAVPQIGHVDLGPPISFTVQIRPGQTIADFLAVAPAIAPAFNVAELAITPLVPHWLNVVLVEPEALVPVPAGPVEAYFEDLRYAT
jgi:hypothetical protein